MVGCSLYAKNPTEMTTSLVTGGAGFIGSHLVDELIQLNHKVVVLDDLSGGKKENVNPEAIFIEGSILDEALIEQLFQNHQFDYVYHLAAYAAEGLSHFIRRFNYQNNIIGSTNLINASVKHQVKCFVFTSSIAVYGNNVAPLNEGMKPQPEDPYGIAKYAVELDLAAANNLFDLNYVIFRPHNVYGERQNIGDPYRNVIGIFMNQILQNKPLTIYGDGNQTRAFTHVNDVAPYIASCIDNEKALNQIFNIGNSDVSSVKEISLATLKVMNSSQEIYYLEARTEVKHAFANHDKFNATFELNKTPQTNLEIGLANMAKWAKENGSEASDLSMEIEVDKNLPENWKIK